MKNTDAEACFGYYYENDLVLNRPPETVFHCVAIHGNPRTQNLLGYVEYFSSIRMIVCLSSQYQGPEVRSTYAIDPLSAQELDFDISIPFTQDDIQAIYRYEKFSSEAMGQAVSKILPIAMKKNYEREKSRIINQAVGDFFKTSGLKEGDMLTKKHIERLAREVVGKLTPFIIRQRSMFFGMF